MKFFVGNEYERECIDIDEIKDSYSVISSSLDYVDRFGFILNDRIIEEPLMDRCDAPSSDSLDLGIEVFIPESVFEKIPAEYVLW